MKQLLLVQGPVEAQFCSGCAFAYWVGDNDRAVLCCSVKTMHRGRGTPGPRCPFKIDQSQGHAVLAKSVLEHCISTCDGRTPSEGEIKVAIEHLRMMLKGES
jgi:hypothetical protein